MSRKKTGSRTQRSKRISYARPDVYVSVYCAGEPDSAHDKWRIASFLPEPTENNTLAWRWDCGSYYEPAVECSVLVSGRVEQYLHDNKWVSPREGNRDLFHSASFRIRWSLTCDKCGLSRSVANPSELYDGFTALAQLQIFEIELAHLVHATRRTK